MISPVNLQGQILNSNAASHSIAVRLWRPSLTIRRENKKMHRMDYLEKGHLQSRNHLLKSHRCLTTKMPWTDSEVSMKSISKLDLVIS